MGSESHLKIGVFFNARTEQGGLYQYALTLVDCLNTYGKDIIFYLYLATLEDFPIEISSPNWHVRKFKKINIQFRMALELLLFHLSRANISIPFSILPEYQQINQDQVDIMLYVKPTPHVYQWHYNSIFPIHDLQHRLQPHFPEVSANGEYARREILYRNSVKNAKAILTDSETGKEDVIQLYHVNQAIVYPLPFIAPTFRNHVFDQESKKIISEKYALPDNYFFYPAAFWPHKNHERLIRALKVLHKKTGTLPHLVLSGSKKREYEKLVEITKTLDLEKFVHFIGFVNENDLPELYHNAIALVMPTFFGPTNIPVLEAWAADCPVISSDIRGIQEQVGNAGILVDPENYEAIANAMEILWMNPGKRLELIAMGREKLTNWTPEHFAEKLISILHAL